MILKMVQSQWLNADSHFTIKLKISIATLTLSHIVLSIRRRKTPQLYEDQKTDNLTIWSFKLLLGQLLDPVVFSTLMGILIMITN